MKNKKEIKINWVVAYYAGVFTSGLVCFLLMPSICKAQNSSTRRQLRQCQNFYNDCQRTVIEKQEKWNWCMIKMEWPREVTIPKSPSEFIKFSSVKTCDAAASACMIDAKAWTARSAYCLAGL